MCYRSLWMGAGVIAFLLCLVSMSANAQCVSGTIDGELQAGGPYPGWYKYTIEITWDLPQGMSHVTLDCGLDLCASTACSAPWEFESPAGHGTGGDPDSCDFEMDGEFNCEGDPSIGITVPILKWEPIPGDCEPSKEGTAEICFYSPFPPDVPTAQVFLIKDGQNICTGSIEGGCPLVCVVPIDLTTWGLLKSAF